MSMNQANRMELAFDLLADIILEFLAKEQHPVLKPRITLTYRGPAYRYIHYPFQYANLEVEYA